MRLTPRRLRSDGPQARDDLAVDLHLAAARRELAEDAVEQRRLAAAVRADQAEDLALLDVEADAVDRGDAAEALADVADFEDRGHGAVSSLDLCDGAQRGCSLGAALGEIAIEDAENAGRRIDQQQDHRDRVEHQIIALREAQPFRQQHRDHRAEERPEEEAGAADDHHHQQIERERQVERHRIDILRQRRIERAGDAAERRADRERHQRVAPGIDAERQRPDRIFAQRHEGAAPGRADQPPHRERDDAERAEADIVERQRPVGRRGRRCSAAECC